MIVINVNDEEPYFPLNDYWATVYENATVRSHVITLQAYDVDQDTQV